MNEYRYAVFVKESSSFNEEYFQDISIYNVIRLYIENSILREKIVFESEHDSLIIKAAESIRSIVSENVIGFRLGGDEFAVAAINDSKEEADDIYKRWKNSIIELNKKNDGIKCVVSCGMAYGEGDYDLGMVIEQADVRMYREKRRLKEKMIKQSMI